MHMADALVSPVIGVSLWTISMGLIFWCSRQVKKIWQDNLVPMMGILGAFIFTAQMINFTIPGTGSSGHLGGCLILTVLLGPHAAFLVMASILTVQALFFADGGLLALGCNMFNLGFFPAFIAWPFIYRPIAKSDNVPWRMVLASVIAAVVGLQLGAFSVVIETTASGLADVPFKTFLLLMQPIHLAIGVVEGVITAMVISFVVRARPEGLVMLTKKTSTRCGMRPIFKRVLMVSLVLGAVLSWFASTQPDGLEWSVFKAADKEHRGDVASSWHTTLAQFQEKISIFPEYDFKKTEEGERWPAVRTGTSLAGLVGGFITFLFVAIISYAIKRKKPC